MNKAKSSEKKDIFQRVTDEIVSAIEAGASSYKMPWKTSGGFPCSPINAVSKRPYRGINLLILCAIAQRRGYQSGLWATFKQWTEMGAKVRKGETSAHVVFWKFLERENSKGEEKSTDSSGRMPMVARDYWIFNAEQVDGFRKVEEAPLSRAERFEQAEEFFKTLGVTPQPGGNTARWWLSALAVLPARA